LNKRIIRGAFNRIRYADKSGFEMKKTAMRRGACFAKEDKAGIRMRKMAVLLAYNFSIFPLFINPVGIT